MTEFHKRLRQAIDVSGLKDCDIAERSGMSPQNLSHVLSKQRSPRLETLARLLDALPDVDARWLIAGKRKAGK